ncbi:hypothetical protein AX774_g2518 [Zancudomyces culisetae]|uniref:Uncharacterized protein n=1 Tax=Zancudomyces culisetae TaxID=1213189 RepID=A0A1R1PSP4_ZANCU|nr:hypothetical protein AX774_g2518 [Zancudomyces culisetae]|eukprot:OMH83971.1 hypothetical protein AX774_g2518 [Zancudomyces culisetae]
MPRLNPLEVLEKQLMKGEHLDSEVQLINECKRKMKINSTLGGLAGLSGILYLARRKSWFFKGTFGLLCGSFGYRAGKMFTGFWLLRHAYENPAYPNVTQAIKDIGEEIKRTRKDGRFTMLPTEKPDFEKLPPSKASDSDNLNDPTFVPTQPPTGELPETVIREGEDPWDKVRQNKMDANPWDRVREERNH